MRHVLRALSVFCASALLCQGAHAAPPGGHCNWPAYNAFLASAMQPDGRVVDATTPTLQSTSEGQSYAMFFALVANDPQTFARALNWVNNNLADGQLDAGHMRLPAWQWGRTPNGNFAVLDPNSAADADLWLAYDLLQAGRLWNMPAYTAQGRALAQNIAAHETIELDGVGPMLLPGSQGFNNGGVVRLNPSYLPLPVLRGLARALPGAPWNGLPNAAYQLISQTAPRGFAPDWAAWRDGAFVVDPVHGDAGSYDAIRTYLWAGLTSSSDPLAKPWLHALSGMASIVQQTGAPPERVSSVNGTVSGGTAPLSYWGALAPYFQALGQQGAAAQARARLTALAETGGGLAYYDRVLGLFGAGALEGRYHFDSSGRLIPAWSKTCD
jgi:endoglucanase